MKTRKWDIFRFSAYFLTIATLLMTLVASSALAEQVLRIRLSTDPVSLDAAFANAGVDAYTWSQVTESLLDQDENGTLLPSLATSWGSKDNKTWILNLRRGVKLHDGTRFEAKLVKWNIERIQNAVKSTVRSAALSIDKIVIVDKYRIRLILKGKNALFADYLAGRMSAIHSPKAIKKYGADYARHPVGTGPFMFKSWKSGTEVVLVKNPKYWDRDRIHFDKLIYKVIPDEGTAFMNLAANKVDLAVNLTPIRAKLVKANPKLKLYSFLSGEFITVYIRQLDKPPFNNKLVRQAMAHAIDKEAINQALFFGTGAVASSGLNVDHWAYDSSTPAYKEANVRKAKELLKKAGYPNGLEGEYVYLTIPIFPFDKTAQIVQQQFAKIGIKIKVEPVGLSTLIQRGIGKLVPLVGLGWSGGNETDTMFQAMIHSKGSYNNTAYVSAAADRLIEEARSTSDRSAQKRAYSKLQKLLADDLPIIPIMHKPVIQASTSRLIGYKVQLDQKFRFQDTWLK
ncbi:MAG: hypothetical protein GY866_06815 [Proteobacteria bacterium]|nr:hypothetical protein [Pseudomonadota bacterium]